MEGYNNKTWVKQSVYNIIEQQYERLLVARFEDYTSTEEMQTIVKHKEHIKNGSG